MSETDDSGNPNVEHNVNKDANQKPTFFQVMMSVFAAAFGVQSAKNRERDFSQSSPLPYIVGGLIFTVVFVLSIVGVVMLVLP